MKLTGAQIIMECLLEQHVDTVFGYPGGAVLNIYDALYEYSDRINHLYRSMNKVLRCRRRLCSVPAEKQVFVLLRQVRELPIW